MQALSKIYWIWSVDEDMIYDIEGVVVNWFYEPFDLVIYLN